MPRFGDWHWLEGRDPENSASRFNRRPAVAFVPGEQLEYDVHVRFGGDLQAAQREAVRREIGEWALAEQPELGAPRLHDGSYGIGAEAWAVVLEWAAQGVVGGAAWVATVAAAHRLRAFVDKLHTESDEEGVVSAGAAHLLAVEAVVSRFADESGPLAIEAIEDASTVGGQEPPTLSYGEEPWIVLLLSRSSLSRYVVIVEANGTTAGVVRVPLGPRARHFIDDLFASRDTGNSADPAPGRPQGVRSGTRARFFSWRWWRRRSY